jgi:beta-galactosidase
MVYIASYWQKNSPLNVRVYSNAKEVELFLNGKSLGKQSPDKNRLSNNLPHPPFTFNLNKFEAGELVAKAYINGEEVATYSVKTPEEISALELTIDESGLAPQAGVNDVVFVYATLKDANGTTVHENGTEIQFEIEGDAVLLNPEAISTEAGIATALIRIGEKNDEIIIKVKTLAGFETSLSFKPE